MNVLTIKNSPYLRTATKIFIGPDNIGYQFSKGGGRDEKLDIYMNGIVVFVFTEPIFSKTKTVTLSNNQTRTTLAKVIDGKNVFTFVIYGNFIVEPTVTRTNGRCYIASKLKSESLVLINSACNPNTSSQYYGNSCAARIIRDGWKINY